MHYFPSLQTEGAPVEYEIEKEESGKLKAINVTAPGGASIKPPKRERKRLPRKGKEEGANGDEAEAEVAADDEADADGAKEGGGAGRSNGRRKGGRSRKTPDGEVKTAEPKPRVPPFHDVINEEAKNSIKAKGVDLGRKMTVDVAFGDLRIKLGQGGYAGLASAKGTIGEGTYTCDDNGLISFTWERCLAFADGKWTSADVGTLVGSLSLANGTSIELQKW